AVTDFFLEAHPRFDVVGILLFGYEAALLMMSLLLREAEEPYRRLWALRPTDALVKRDGNVYRVRIEDVTPEDRLVVETGATVPVDGTVQCVASEVPAVVDSTELLGIGGDDDPNDQVTGERVRIGDRVLAGSVVSRGKIVIEPLGREQSLLYRLLRTIEIGDERGPGGTSGRGLDWGRLATSLLPMPIVRARERLEARYGTLGARHARFVVIGLLASTATLITWLTRSHGQFGAIYPLFAPAIAIAVLAGAWVMAWGPILATVSALGSASRRGVLFRDAAALDAILDLDLVVFASEGTLTEGEPAVQRLVCHDATIPEATVLSFLLAAMVESEEPIADSIREYAASRGLDARGDSPPPGYAARSFRHLPGQGVIVVVDSGEGGQEVLVGRASLLEAKSVSSAGLAAPLASESDWVHLAVNGKVLASLHIHDSIRPECTRAGKIARSQGRAVALLETSGGQGRAAEQLGCSKTRPLTVCGGPEDHAAFVSGEVTAGRRVGVVGRLDGDRLALEDATMRIGILPKSGVIDDAADVLLLKPGVQGFITAVRAARSARFGSRISAVAGVVGLLAGIPAALGYLDPAGAAMVSLGLLVVTGLIVRVRSRWLD
ncbi:MAG: cation-translocating P-type ATPase, partial [Myxococcales bacterium]|nr:cation-translocating P-type ATPase [Myxococcales bacterium]